VMGIIVLFMHLFPGLPELFRPHNEEAIAEYISEQGHWKGQLCVILMNIVQVASIFLSGNIIYIAAGLIYPWYEAFLLCWIPFLLTNFAVYGIARTIAKPFGSRLAASGRFDKISKRYGAVKPSVVVFLANLLPGIPNGFCPYIAAFMKLSFGEAVAAITFSSWVQVLTYCVVGHLFIRGSYLPSIAIAAAEYALGVILFLNRSRLAKFLDRIAPCEKRSE